MTIGVYKLIFGDGSFYIGKSVNIERRVIAHKCTLNKQEGTFKIQQAFNKTKTFTHEVLQQCNEIELDHAEIYWISKLKACILGLNISSGGDGASSGELNPKAKYSNSEIDRLFHYILNNPNTNLKVTSDILNISYSTVQNLCNGSVHLWLKEKYPEKYTEFISIKGTRHTTSQSYLGKGLVEPKVVSPSGEVLTVSSNTSFAKKYNLDASNFRKMLIGKHKTCKGWTLYKGEVS